MLTKHTISNIKQMDIRKFAHVSSLVASAPWEPPHHAPPPCMHICMCICVYCVCVGDDRIISHFSGVVLELYNKTIACKNYVLLAISKYTTELYHELNCITG